MLIQTLSDFYVSVSCIFLFHVSNTNSADSWCDTCACIGEAADSDHEDCVTCEEGCQQCLTGQYIIIWMDVCTTSIAHEEMKCIMFSAKKNILSVKFGKCPI